MRTSTHPVIVALLLSVAMPVAAAPLAFPAFKVQEIDRTLKVGYGVRLADLNADGKLDIVVADSARVIWFDNAGGWKLHTIIDNAKAGVKADNVCLAVHDVDGDGKLDVVLGADWQVNNTTAGGSLQWLRQGKTIDEWTVHKIAGSIPTLHRVHFADVDGDGRQELLVGPIRGKGSTPGPNYMDKPVQLFAYKVPKDPAGKWDEPRVLEETLHHLHNFWVPPALGSRMILTASAEGVGVLAPGEGGNWKWTCMGAGNQDNPKGARGSSEAKVGFRQGSPSFMAAIEPLHGNQVVTYHFVTAKARDGEAPPPQPAGPGGFRTVIDSGLKGGHALWCADLDGDGLDEIIAGCREPVGGGPGVVVAYKASGTGPPFTWEKHVIDGQSMACEDLACGDLDGDGKLDIVAAGRSTGNVRIYWNQGTPGGNPGTP
jgi:hypothetical protein